MSERLNKTSICSVVFLDIVNQSKKPVAEQIRDKELFNGFINEAIKDVAQNDRILLDTGDGAAIALLGAPEEALFVAMTIRDSILKHNKDKEQKLFVRTGINLGPVRVVSDINGRPNILGDGINVAERVMSFTEPNQILVSRSYYEITSRLTEEITGLFAYFGVKQDKHIREHEVYMIRSPEDEAAPAIGETTTLVAEKQSGAWLAGLMNNDKFSRYLLWGGGALVLAAVSISGFMLVGNLFSPDLANVTTTAAPAPDFSAGPSSATTTAAAASPVVAPAAATEANPAAVPGPNDKQEVAKAEPVPVKKEVAKAEPRKRKVTSSKKKETETAPTPDSSSSTTVAANPTQHHEATVKETHESATDSNEKSGWAAFKESIKKGREERVCSQGEIALGQCK